MRHTKTITSILALSLSLVGFSAFAQQSTGTFPRPQKSTTIYETKPHVGVFLGSVSPTGQTVGGADYGVDIGYQPYIPLGLGVELSGTRAGSQQVRLLAHATYNFGGDIPVIKNSYIGAAAGPLWGSVGDPNRVLLGFAPLVGFDIPVPYDSDRASNMSLGVQAKYIFVEGSDPDTVNVNGVVKYWF